MSDFTLHQSRLNTAAKFSVAPMMSWTDRHCRFFHRQFTKDALLYTEMVTAAAVVYGKTTDLLSHNPVEHPVAVQLGGSDPALLKAATEHCVAAGFSEVNLNVGCPSDRVQSGAFGAVLMKSPKLVADCVTAMQQVPNAVVTVKCRIGVDDQTPADVLPDFLSEIADAGIDRVTVHARKAWLSGLSPKENRDVPPLDYDLVIKMKDRFPNLHMSVNGGITDFNDVMAFLDQGLDGVMIGRAAYHTPDKMLIDVDHKVFGTDHVPTAWNIIAQMRDYIAQHVENGGRIHDVTRHMLGMFSGQKGAKFWRRGLSDLGAQKNAQIQDLDQFLDRCRDYIENEQVAAE